MNIRSKNIALLFSCVLLSISCVDKYLPDSLDAFDRDVNFTTKLYRPQLGKNTLMSDNFSSGNSTLPLTFEISRIVRADGSPAPELTEYFPVKVWKTPYMGTEKSIEEIEAKREIEYRTLFQVKKHSGEFMMWSNAESSFVQCAPSDGYIFDVLVKNSGGAFKVALSISGVALEQLEIHAPAVIDLLHQLNDTGCCEFLCEPYSHGLSSLANEDCFREEVLRQRDKMKQMFGKEPKVFRNSSLIYSDEIGGLVASMGFKGMLTEGAKHVLGWKSPHYVYHCNQAPSLKLLLRDFKLSDDIGLRFSNSEWPEYPLFADKYINWIDALPQEEQVINIFMELSALGMAQPLSSNILEFLKALPECAKSKGITFSTPTEIVSKLKSVSQLDVPYPMSWVDEERDTSSWLGNILQREAFNKLYSVAERVHLCDDRRIKQDWDYLQASNNFRFMTTKNTGIWLNRGIYDSPYDAFTNYMNILGDFIKRVDSLYPVDVDNEELNSLLTTIKNQGEEIAELQKEVTKWQAKAEKGAVKAPKKVAAKKEPVAKATRKKATAKKEE